MGKVGLWSRAGALLIDNILIIATIVGILTMHGIEELTAIEMAGYVYITYTLITPYMFKGYHLGKYILGFKIVKDNEEKPGIINILVREGFKVLYALPLIGGILIVISSIMITRREDEKALHDVIAKTKVVRVSK